VNMENQKGFIALITVLIISAILLMISISSNLFGISESDMGLQKSQASQAFYLANLCSEDALMKLKNDINYLGNENLIFDNGSCSILPIESGSGESRTVKTIGSIQNQIRKIRIEMGRINPSLQISLWQEVSDF